MVEVFFLGKKFRAPGFTIEMKGFGASETLLWDPAWSYLFYNFYFKCRGLFSFYCLQTLSGRFPCIIPCVTKKQACLLSRRYKGRKREDSVAHAKHGIAYQRLMHLYLSFLAPPMTVMNTFFVYIYIYTYIYIYIYIHILAKIRRYHASLSAIIVL